MTEKQATNYFKCGECKKKPVFKVSSYDLDWLCEIALEEAMAGDWQNRPACGEFEGEK